MDGTDARQNVAEVWHEFWRAHSQVLEQRAPQYIIDVLTEETEPAPGRRILEAGSGTGGLSQGLARQGADVTVMDIVPACIKAVRGKDAAPGVMRGVVGDLFYCPFADASFDVVFNSGVMEHFEPDDLRLGLLEMARLLKPGGKLVCLVPSARGRFYTWGKRRLEAAGKWEFGVEYPQRSLRPHLDDSGLEYLREYQIGVRHQKWFVRGKRRRIAQLLLLPFPGERNRLAAAIFGGYLLASVWRKPEADGKPQD